MKFKFLTDTATEPNDLYADSCNGGLRNGWSLIIQPNETVKVGTGIAVAIPDGYFGGIYARSGLATKKGLAPANKVGVIDSDYRGEIIVALHNHSTVPQTISQGERIAQLIIQPYTSVEWEEAEELDSTERGDGGFGSTGKN